MNMHILSDHQFQQITKALELASTALQDCQHVELDLTKAKQSSSTTEQLVRTNAVQKPKSQSKTRKSSHKRGRGVQVLNEGQVLEIKRQLLDGTSAAKVARAFGVHVTTINCIKWGKTWKHVQLQQVQEVAE